MYNRFRALWKRIGARPGLLSSCYKDLKKHYESSGRFYHNFKHIEWCLFALDELLDVDKSGYLKVYQNEIAFALWYHDVIYDPQSHGNELKSAEYAVSVCKKIGLGDKFSKVVKGLILATEHDGYPLTTKQKIMVDIDLGILGDSYLYNSYEEAIRKEYAFVSEDLFRAGRSKILQKFLNRKRIYFTDYFFKRYEKNARKNLKWAIENLK